ncbi:hypothetical protein FB645_006201 [Coemansia sp. IMI 203386]|nr:hypothetical protein FB645_006201 [Coemansia sp. IMI 203386]
MERRSNQDLGNFFNRITNVDALKSPFPRHLRQPAQNTPSAGPTSTRPVLNSADNSHRLVRPVSGHGVPRWQYPAAASSSDISVSPVGSTAQPNNGLDLEYIQPAPYRLPAGYPSSVQPIRVRPYSAGADSRLIPGSTLPTHIIPSSATRTHAAENSSQCQLQNWFLVLDPVKGNVSVHGNSVNAEGVYVVRRSSSILQTLGDRSLVTAKGSCYKLVGPANLDMMRLKGFPEHLLPYFGDGFPQSWRQLLDSYLGKPANGGYAKTQGLQSSRSEVIPRPSSSSVKQNDTFAEPSGAALPSSSGLSGSTFKNQTLSPELPSAQSKALGNPSSVYSSGSSLFSSRKFACNFSPKARRTSSGDQHAVGLDSIALQEVDEEDGVDEKTGKSCTLGNGAKPADSFSLSSEAEYSSEPRSRRPTPRVSSSKENESDLNDMFAKPAVPVPSIQRTPSFSGSKRRVLRKTEDSSDELSGSTENPRKDVVLGLKIADSDNIDIASMETPSKPPRQKISNGNSATRASARRLSRDNSGLSPSVQTTNSVSRASPASARKLKPSPAKAIASTPNNKRVSRGSISLRTRSAQKELPASDLEADGPLASEGDVNAGTGTEELLEDLRLNLGGETDESEEPSANLKVTPKRRARVAGQPSSARKVILDSSDCESRAEAAESDSKNEGQSQGQQELKTPRSGIKWKTGRRYFRYKEPEAGSSSITRSGRKVRKPQDWWANAQDHLGGSGSGHKESNIKYKWGSGDAMVIRDGKRMRLSDFYLQGGDESALFSEEAHQATKDGEDGEDGQRSNSCGNESS